MLSLCGAPVDHAVSLMFQAGRQPRLPKAIKRWLFPASSGLLFLLSVVMTGCFLWQYHLPKLQTGEYWATRQVLPGSLLPRVQCKP